MDGNQTKKDPLWRVQLPTGLQRKVAKQIMTAAVITLAVVILAVYYMTPIYLAGLAIPAALVYLVLSMGHDFERGAITELAVVCNNVSTYPLRDTTHVTFRTDGEDPHFYSFVIPGKTAKRDMIPNAPYLIYFKVNQPTMLLGYTPL